MASEKKRVLELFTVIFNRQSMKWICSKTDRSGVSLIEVIIVFGLFLLLIGLGTVSTGRITQQVSLQSVTDQLLGEIGNQQQQAMTGYDRAGNSNEPHGVRFEPDRYILFAGNTYSASDPDNVVVDLPQTLGFSTIDLPDQQLVFATGSGQLANYDGAHNSVVLTDQVTGNTKSFEWNTLGILTQ